MTLPAAVVAAAAIARGWRKLAAPARIVVVAALAPPALYLARGLLLKSFEPLARFALVPGTLLLPLAAAAVPAARARAFGVATAASAVVFRSPSGWWRPWDVTADPWVGAESMGAVTRLDGEDREHDRRVRRPARAQRRGQRAVLAVEAGQRAHRLGARPDAVAPDGRDQPDGDRKRDRRGRRRDAERAARARPGTTAAASGSSSVPGTSAKRASGSKL